MRDDYSKLKSEAIADLFEAIKSAVKVSLKARLDTEYFHHQVVVGSYMAMIETSESIRVLLDADKAYDAEILLRTLMELRVRLEVFAKNKDVVDRERLEFFRRTHHTLKEAERGNRYLVKIATEIDSDVEIKKNSQKLADLKAKGIKRQLKFSQMCERLGFEDEYMAIYSGLSQTPYGTYSSMIKRNFVIDENDKKNERSRFSTSRNRYG